MADVTDESGLREKIAVALCLATSPIDGIPILGLDPDFHDRPDHPDHCDEDEVCAVDVLALADAVLALISPAGEVSGWQPIETAPRDGTAILGYFDGRVFVTEWDTTFRMWTDYFAHWMPLPAAPRGMEG